MCGMAATSASGTNAVRSACMAGTQSDEDIQSTHTQLFQGEGRSLFKSNTVMFPSVKCVGCQF